MAFELERPWALSPQVSLRPERFGALAYHFGTRRLSFLKSPRLLRVVESLADAPTALAACRRAGVPEAQMAEYARALATLANTDMICRRPGGVAPGPAAVVGDIAPPGDTVPAQDTATPGAAVAVGDAPSPGDTAPARDTAAPGPAVVVGDTAAAGDGAAARDTAAQADRIGAGRCG